MDKHLKSLLPLAIIVGIISVSTASIFIKFAQQDAPSLVIAALRLVIASLLIAPYAFIRYRKELFNLTKKEVFLGFLSGFFLALHFSTWISSLEYTSIASSVVLVSTGPLWVAIFSPFILKETLSKKIFWGLLLAIVGGIFIALSDSCELQSKLVCTNFSTLQNNTSMLGNLLATTGALAVTGYLMIGRRLRTRISLIPYIFLVYSMAAIFLILFMLIAGQSPFGLPKLTYFWIFLLAVIPQLIGHSTYNWTLRFLPATIVAILTLGEPLGSITLAYFILRETPSIIKVVGGIFILSGIYLASRFQNSKEEPINDHKWN